VKVGEKTPTSLIGRKEVRNKELPKKKEMIGFQKLLLLLL
jgi:hypothetical protein